MIARVAGDAVRWGLSRAYRGREAEHTDHSVPRPGAVQTAFCKLVRRGPGHVDRPGRLRPTAGRRRDPAPSRRVAPVNLYEFFLNWSAQYV